MDGDEYAGIEAAHKLIEKYGAGEFAGRLIIVPTVNMAGFKNNSSRNPEDDRFPKNIFPGHERGSPSERLIHWLNCNYVTQADAWLDLHGGALTERLTPFLWCYRTGVAAVDALSEKFYKASGADIVLLQKAGMLSGMFSKARMLAKRKKPCVYAMAESGERGERNTQDIERHLRWTEILMQQLGMLPAAPREQAPETAQRVLHHIAYVYAGDQAPDTTRGTVLWHDEATAPRKGDIIYGIGY